MKKMLSYIILALYMLAAGLCQAQDYTTLISLAEKKYEASQYRESAELYEKAFELEEGNAYAYYKAAASWAMAEEADNAFDHLNSAIEKGFKKINVLKEDKDFESLRADSRWLVLTAKLQAKIDRYEASFNRELRGELLSMQDEDQESRRIWGELEQIHGPGSPPADSMLIITLETDAKNTKRLKEIIRKQGFPKKDTVGVEGIFAAFLIIQHSADVQFQKDCLPFLLEAAKRKELKYAPVAFLQDKLLVKDGRKQLYGTQLTVNKSTGKKEVYPIEDEAGVDERREEAGLPPLGEYLRKLGITYSPKE